MLYSKATCVSLLLLLLSVAPAACKGDHSSNEVQIVLIGVVVVIGILFMIFLMKCISYMKAKQEDNPTTRPISPIAVIDMSAASYDDPPPVYQEDLPPPYSSLVFYKVPAVEPVVVKIPI